MSTHTLSLDNFPEITIKIIYTLYVDRYLLLASLLGGVIFIHYESFQFYTIIGDSSPPSHQSRKEKHTCFM